METNSLFIQRLCDLQKIRNLQKLFELKNCGSEVNNIVSTSLDSLVYQQQSHAHLAALAAMSYWRSDKNQIEIAIALVQPDKSHTITMKAPTASIDTDLLP